MYYCSSRSTFFEEKTNPSRYRVKFSFWDFIISGSEDVFGSNLNCGSEFLYFFCFQKVDVLEKLTESIKIGEI